MFENNSKIALDLKDQMVYVLMDAKNYIGII